jgi:NTE family protein
MTRVGVVLGAGGITGIAWLLGALEAVHRHTGWDPGTADVLTGTSAGAVAATVLASGAEPGSLLAMAEQPQLLDARIRQATAGASSGGRRGPGWPGSVAHGVSGLLVADPRRRVASLAGFLPRGLRSGDEIRGLTHEAVQGGWPAHTNLRLHACDFRSGHRVTFGGPDAPPATLADALVASCAVPGYYRPVRIGGRDYVDGGLTSFSNADALLDQQCDVVLCLSPFSSRARGSLLDTTLFGPMRRVTAWRLAQEAAQLRATGTRVVVVEPAGAELQAMGLNVMDRGRSRLVLETAVASVGARLDALLDGVDLPAPSSRADAPALAA